VQNPQTFPYPIDFIRKQKARLTKGCGLSDTVFEMESDPQAGVAIQNQTG
jgi:hypothetical protein